MITTMIIEDEQAARERMMSLIAECPDLTLLGICENGKEAIQKIDALKPQLIFLDIQLPDMNGLDVLRMITHQPKVIFTTAFDQYAVQAFDHNALDFLLKPFSRQRFSQAVQKIIQSYDQNRNITGQLRRMMQNWQEPRQFLTRIPAKVGDKIYILKTSDIVYFKSEEKIVTVHLQKEYFMVNYTLEELQNRLNPEIFFRIHRSTIVNLNYALSIQPLFGGTYVMKVKDAHHTELNVSRSAGKTIRQRLGW